MATIYDCSNLNITLLHVGSLTDQMFDREILEELSSHYDTLLLVKAKFTKSFYKERSDIDTEEEFFCAVGGSGPIPMVDDGSFFGLPCPPDCNSKGTYGDIMFRDYVDSPSPTPPPS